jgi:uncharacterized protein (DUF2235 family)
MQAESNRQNQPRNLVVFADGTGQDGGVTHNTNIYKMFAMAEDRTPRQLCYYHSGVGTSRWTRLLGLASGWGFGANVRACYAFLHEEYRADDRIFLIGFSRGAATVRSLAYFIHLFGILPRSRHELVLRAWRIYTIRNSEKRQERAKRFIEANPTMWANVHFVGCFDTVAALGAPYQWASKAIDYLPACKHRFHNMRLSPCVVHAYHALALDDERRTFHPLLWDPLEKEANRASTNPQAERLSCDTLRQVWFAGMHSDVGGGYEQQALSDIPLAWLTSRAVEHGFHVYQGHRINIKEDANGYMHDSRAGRWRIYRRAQRAWDTNRLDKPVLHGSVAQRMKDRRNQDGPYMPWLKQYTPDSEAWLRYQDGQWTES